jgi:signal peptidase II
VRELQAAGGTSLTGPGIVSEQEQPVSAAPGGWPAGQRRVGVLLAIAVTVLTCDIVTKTIVVATLSDRAPLRLLGGLLTLRVSRNPGAAFSIGPSMTLVFSVIAAGVIIVILRTSRRIRNLPWAITLGLLLGGATGNLIDRLFRYPGPFLGYVVDWIQVPHWPVFNIADSSVVCGGVLAVFLAVRGVRIDGPEPGQPQSQAGPGDPASDVPASGHSASGDLTSSDRASDDPAGGARAGGDVTSGDMAPRRDPRGDGGDG